MIQCVRQPGLASVWERLLGFEGHEFYSKTWPELDGLTVEEVSATRLTSLIWKATTFFLNLIMCIMEETYFKHVENILLTNRRNSRVFHFCAPPPHTHTHTNPSCC